MTDFLYYPGFEIEDDEWLKFALLYMIKVHTIVPFEADNYLSVKHRDLKNSTNLLESYRPTYDEGEKSTYDAIDIIQNIINKPKRNLGILGEVNILDFWRQIQYQDTELFNTKFSPEFVSFCGDYGLCHETYNGIRLPKQLALIYMSVFAHNIGDHTGMSVITDTKEQRQISRINNKAWKYNPCFEELKSMKKLIELQIPVNLKEIPLVEIIKLRNKQSFQKKLNAFHTALSDFTNTTGQKLTEGNCKQIKEHLKASILDLTVDITGVATGTVATALGVWLVFSSHGSNYELAKEFLGFGATVGGAIQVYDKIQTTQNKYLAARYLTDLKKLGRNHRALSPMS
ncbi:hypothetical protein IAW_05009 [Bacillus cereus str. Schrouff]|uniref:hypothetical protein n=1 Tax=Bacillus cereus TaxID=1396 RepID=UPI00032DB4C2|nr:hypothetical protein [Bacillus cereus]EOO05700.1 hypothetical protein IAW_05009 [Bacillus cereus str. Schrouff]EOO81842.1 hypothetical protein IGY_05553 [Bacillus cereus K-5975c]MCU4896392.1 hypothetical protein [Bacillus cereus]